MTSILFISEYSWCILDAVTLFSLMPKLLSKWNAGNTKALPLKAEITDLRHENKPTTPHKNIVNAYIYIFTISIAPQRALKIVNNAISFALYPDASKTSTLITSWANLTCWFTRCDLWRCVHTCTSSLKFLDQIYRKIMWATGFYQLVII